MLHKGLWFNVYSTSWRMVPNLGRILLLRCAIAMLSAGSYSVLSDWQLLSGSECDITSGSHGHWPNFTLSFVILFPLLCFYVGILCWLVKGSVKPPNINIGIGLQGRKSEFTLRILDYFYENKWLFLPWWNALQCSQQMTYQVLWNDVILWSQCLSLLPATWTFSNNSSRSLLVHDDQNSLVAHE